MSIATRIEAIEQHLKDDYDVLGLAGAKGTELPIGYTQVDYIESSGTQYIDTMISSITRTFAIEMDFSITTQQSFQTLYCCRTDNATNTRSCFVTDLLGFRNDQGYQYGVGATLSLNKKYKLESTETKFTLDGALLSNITTSTAVNSNVRLLSAYPVGSTSSVYPFYGRLYGCKIWDNNILKRDYVPCYNSNNEIGLYDLVNDVFYTNQGTGAFTYGSVVLNRNIQNLKPQWLDRLVYFMNNGLDVVWNNWEKVSGSGETITLNNTIEAKMDFVYKGNTSQKTTTGKNLFDNVYGQTRNVYTKNINAPSPLGSVDCYPINLLPNTQYTLKIDMNGYQKTGAWIAGVCFENGDVISLLQSNSMENITTTTFTTDSTGVVYVGQRYGFTYGETGRMDLFLQTAKIQLEKGTTATDWEKYSGGNPAPNPDYPQDIQVVSGDNTIKVEGKNLYTNEIEYNNSVLASNGTINSATGFIISKPISIDISKDIYVSFVAGSLTDKAMRVGYYDGNDNFISRPNFETTPTKLTPPSNAQYLRLSYDARNFSNVQVEYNQATTYEPYQSATYPISLGNIELCKIGTYQDKIAKSTGKNLFDVSTITENTYIDENGNTGTSSVTNLSDYIEVKSNTSYTLSYDYSTLLNSNQRNVCYYNENKTFISSDAYIPTDKTHAITTPNNAKYLRFSYDKNCYSIMINEGNTSLPYEPYGKVWCLNKQIGKVVLDGSELWDYYTSTSKPVFFIVTENFGIYYKREANLSCYCDYYKGKGQVASFDDVYNLGNNVIAFRTAYTRLVIRDDRFNNTEDFRAELSTHNTIVYYVLATPTTTEITDTTLISQLEAIKKSYNTQTNISQTNTDKPFILDVVALGELD